MKPKSSTPVSNPFSALEDDNMDDLVDDIRKRVGEPSRWTGI